MGKSLSNDIKWHVIYHQLDGFSAKETALRLYIVFLPYIKLENFMIVRILSTLVKDKKDWYLDELASKMERLTGKLVSIPTLWRALNHLGITRKKEVNKDERSLSRAYGYCLKNMRVEKHVVFVRGKRYTILPVLTLDGFIAADIMKGSCNKKRFQTFILTQVLPQMNEYPNKNSVIVMDNAKIHHDEKLVESIEQMGCKVLYLPPYSPDYNPIEMAFSGVKS
ncbi:hypothetical protein GLOIN_2v1435777 [Rhizophagus irregularis DAOM 181602=DAOM 197198]|nr:hypothetical protein GLOIN_2v1435777 [Rhizophagus irregularis DAOM 181602=DAOM 197198]